MLQCPSLFRKTIAKLKNRETWNAHRLYQRIVIKYTEINYLQILCWEIGRNKQRTRKLEDIFTRLEQYVSTPDDHFRSMTSIFKHSVRCIPCTLCNALYGDTENDKKDRSYDWWGCNRLVLLFEPFIVNEFQTSLRKLDSRNERLRCQRDIGASLLAICQFGSGYRGSTDSIVNSQ